MIDENMSLEKALKQMYGWNNSNEHEEAMIITNKWEKEVKYQNETNRVYKSI